MRSFWLAIPVWLLLLSAVSGQEPREELPVPRPVDEVAGLTLSQLVQFTLSGHPSLAAAAAAVEESQGRAAQAGLYPNPQFNAQAAQLGGADNQFPFTISQELITGGKLTLDQAAAAQQVLQREQRYTQIWFEVLTRVRQAFYATLTAQRRVETLRRLTDLLRQSRDLAQRRLEGGQGTETDIILLELELTRVEVDLQEAEGMWAARRQELVAATGAVGYLTVEQVDGNLESQVALADYSVLLTSLLATNAEARIADLEIQHREFLRQRAEVEPIPNVTVTGGYLRNTADDMVENQFIVGVSLPVPLWNRNQGNRYAAGAALHEASASAAAVRTDLATRLAEAWGRYESARRQVTVYADTYIPKAERAIELTQKGLEAGQFDTLRLLAAQQALLRAELGRIQVDGQRWAAIVDLAGLLQIEQLPE